MKMGADHNTGGLFLQLCVQVLVLILSVEQVLATAPMLADFQIIPDNNLNQTKTSELSNGTAISNVPNVTAINGTGIPPKMTEGGLLKTLFELGWTKLTDIAHQVKYLKELEANGTNIKQLLNKTASSNGTNAEMKEYNRRYGDRYGHGSYDSGIMLLPIFMGRGMFGGGGSFGGGFGGGFGKPGKPIMLKPTTVGQIKGSSSPKMSTFGGSSKGVSKGSSSTSSSSSKSSLSSTSTLGSRSGWSRSSSFGGGRSFGGGSSFGGGFGGKG